LFKYTTVTAQCVATVTHGGVENAGPENAGPRVYVGIYKLSKNAIM